MVDDAPRKVMISGHGRYLANAGALAALAAMAAGAIRREPAPVVAQAPRHQGARERARRLKRIQGR